MSSNVAIVGLNGHGAAVHRCHSLDEPKIGPVRVLKGSKLAHLRATQLGADQTLAVDEGWFHRTVSDDEAARLIAAQRGAGGQ